MNKLNIKNGGVVFRLLLFIFAIIGLIFVFVFIAMQFNLLNVKGSVSQRNSYFDIKRINKQESINSLETICKINVLGKYAPFTAVNIYKAHNLGVDDALLGQMINVASNRFLGIASFSKNMESCVGKNNVTINIPMTAYAWADTDQWNLMKEVFTRDQEVIKKAAKDAQISPRLILASVIGEQFRFFNNRRESFKGYFEPLKILASLSKVSFGIAGIKPKTVNQIEEHLKNENSPFYLGKDMEHILDYPIGADIETEQMNRITNTKDPYYSYL